MCLHLRVCKACHDPRVEAWADGRTNLIPRFGDMAQREMAIGRRTNHILRLIHVGGLQRLRASSAEWPRVIFALGATRTNELPHILACVPEESQGRTHHRRRRKQRYEARKLKALRPIIEAAVRRSLIFVPQAPPPIPRVVEEVLVAA